MSKDLETQLRAALRPVVPREEFTAKLLAAVTAKQAEMQAETRAQATRLGRFRGGSTSWWLGAGIAACLLIGIGVQQRSQEQNERQSGLEARRQVLQALHVTSQKLDLAYEAVKTESSSLTDEKSGV
jgi:hypothetical protein